MDVLLAADASTRVAIANPGPESAIAPSRSAIPLLIFLVMVSATL
jgi:hypothetical protein